MQSSYRIYIKGMVCDRCIQAIREVLQELHIPYSHIDLGAVTTIEALSLPDITALEQQLQTRGFTLLEDKKTKLVRTVKALVEEVYSGTYDFPAGFRFSDRVIAALYRDYNTVSTAFSASEGVTLEKYVMGYRMEKTKELLVYTGAPLADIAFRLGFSSAAHLSRQFKAHTGLQTSHFRAVRQSKTALTRPGSSRS